MANGIERGEARLLRPLDLLDVRILWDGLEVVPATATEPAMLRPTRRGSLRVVFPPQHVAEQVVASSDFEDLDDAQKAALLPTASRFAGPSFLQFTVSARNPPIPLTIAGLLDAMGRLELVVAGTARHPTSPGHQEEPRPPWPAPGAHPQVTAIEVPSRLIVSPGSLGGWAHASEPVTSGDRTELWHTRLAKHRPFGGGVDEGQDDERVIRAIWTRDLTSATWPPPPLPSDVNEQFATALRPKDRIDLVRRTADWTDPTNPPEPVQVEQLALTSLGAYLDVAGKWASLGPSDSALTEWEHRATLGRDHFVRTVHEGFLYPFGHRARWITITERRVESIQGKPVALLLQESFVIVREPLRRYSTQAQRSFPFRSVRIGPRVTPPLEQSENPIGPVWPEIDDGVKFLFTITAVDQDGDTHGFRAPLVFVPDGSSTADVYDLYGLTGAKTESTTPPPGTSQAVRLDLAGRTIAFAPEEPSGQARYETEALRLGGAVANGTSTPTLIWTDLVVPAVAQLTGKRQPITMAYAGAYTAGPDGPDGPDLVMECLQGIQGQADFSNSTDRSGGFINPSMRFNGLSRRFGPVDVASLADDVETFDIGALFGDAGKLFGLFSIRDLLQRLGFDEMPKFVSKALSVPLTILEDLERLRTTLPAELQSHAQAARNAMEQALDPGDADTIGARLATIDLHIGQLNDALADSPLPAGRKQMVEQLLANIKQLRDRGQELIDLIVAVRNFEPPTELLNHVYLEWRPKLNPAVPSADVPLLTLPENGLLLTVDARSGDGIDPSVDVMAVLENFALLLIPGFELMQLNFERIMFRAGTNRKVEIDVKFTGLEFLGVLGFVDTLRQYLPLDGFSDPPGIDVTAEGVTAGYSLELPTVAVGVFNLSNIAIIADCRVPFVGTSPSVGFAFCTREQKFNLTVAFLGGGGFLGVRLNTQRLELLEGAAEFAATLALDLGVASGSVSIAAGVYFTLQADEGELSGYLQIRGEVDVLGLISASIELHMSLTYEFGSGKVVGRASIFVEVEVLFFSQTVKIECERKFAGSNGDPTFAELMAPGGDLNPWIQYCSAFAEV